MERGRIERGNGTQRRLVCLVSFSSSARKCPVKGVSVRLQRRVKAKIHSGRLACHQHMPLQGKDSMGSLTGSG